MLQKFLPALLAFGPLLSGAPALAELPVEVVGNPFEEKWPHDPYARNIWDMKVFDGILYIGAGNSANDGPSPNAGPVPLIAYDGARFSKIFDLPEEQIDLFYEADGSLFIPGHDAKESWSFGNYYTLEKGTWEKHRNIPRGIHVYDMRHFNGQFVAAGGSFGQPTDGWISRDGGKNWQPGELLPNPAFATASNPEGKFRRLWAGGIGGRFYSLLPVGKTLYASGVVPLLPDGDDDVLYRATLFEYDPVRFGFKPVRIEVESIQPDTRLIYQAKSLDIFPGKPARRNDLPVARKVTVAGDRTYYIGSYVHNDHQWRSFGLFVMTPSGKATNIAVPADVNIRDILLYKRNVYVLVDQPTDQGQHSVSVLRVEGDNSTHKLGSFVSVSFARSFEIFGDNIYFGMGADDDGADVMALSGRVLRVRLNNLSVD